MAAVQNTLGLYAATQI